MGAMPVTLPLVINWVTPLATGVLTFFAGVQIWQVRKESKDRQRAAFASLYAEYLHLSSISAEWAEEDLVELALSDALRPEDMLPATGGRSSGSSGRSARPRVRWAPWRTRPWLGPPSGPGCSFTS